MQCLRGLEQEGAAAIAGPEIRRAGPAGLMRHGQHHLLACRALGGHTAQSQPNPLRLVRGGGAQAPSPIAISMAPCYLYVCLGPGFESLRIVSQAKAAVALILTIDAGSSRAWRPEFAREDVRPMAPGQGPRLRFNLFSSFLLQIRSFKLPGCHTISHLCLPTQD